MQSASGVVIGWDIGGAHVKASRLEDGRLTDAAQWPAPLWQGLQHLDEALEAAGTRWHGLGGHAHAVTMSAEMTDLFEDREAGVAALVGHLYRRLGSGARFYAGGTDWLAPEPARRQWRRVASANWLATAHYAAKQLGEALLLDVGSTTTDIVPLHAHEPCPRGRSDAERLACGELVYLGIARTPLCALAERIGWQGRELNVMNEFFASSADIYRLCGELDPAHDQHPAADGGPKDLAGSRRRLARMIGHDARDADDAAWRELALRWRARLEDRILANLERVLAEARLDAQAPLLAAGCGGFVAARLARRLARPCIAFHQLAGAPDALAAWTDICAPAAAVAGLYAQRGASCG